MSGINKVIIIGNLGQDPEVRHTQSGVAVASLSIATSETWKDKDTGEKQEATEWHRVVAWRRLGEICGEYLRKGSKVYIEGKLQTRKWQDKDGSDRYTTEIVANQMQMLDGRGQQQTGGRPGDEYRAQHSSQQGAHQQAKQNGYQPQGGVDIDGDIPF